jgi:hypothetical protein
MPLFGLRIAACGGGTRVSSFRAMAPTTRGSRFQARRVSALVLALVVVILAGSGCGASNNQPTAELLRSANPVTSDFYLQIKGPAGAVNEIANKIKGGAFTSKAGGPLTKAGNGSFVPPRLHNRLQEHQICLFVRTIRPWDSPELQAWVGKTITISAYGNKRYLLWCRLFPRVVLGAHP